MRTQILKALVVVGLVTQIACENSKSKGLDTGSKKQVFINSAMSSADLIEAGEQLITPTQFMVADKVFDMALEQDPNNFKALFYKQFLKSFMVNKGILTRVKPLIAKHGNLSEYEKSIKAMPDTPASRFLLDGKEDISKIKDVQTYLSDYQSALNDFRKFLIENQDKQLSIEISSAYLENLFKDTDSYECVPVSASGQNLYQYECDVTNITKRKLTTPDFMAIRQSLAGMIFFMNFYTAYSFEGIEILKTLDIKEGAAPAEVLNIVSEKLPEFGKLRSQNLLKETLNLGSDLVSAGRWAVQYQNQLCPKGTEVNQQRKGYLFHKGICVKNADETLRGLAMLEQVMSSTIKVKLGEKSEEFEMDYLAWYKNPVQDLLALAPKSFNSCGQATALKDNSLGGVFVNNDADKLLVQSNCP
tara:strand:+ start:2778 stop:4025 length:1248 start_codon:yes stop_codon:yes gene_type:complete